MNTRQAYRTFIRHQLEVMSDEGEISLSCEEIEAFVSGAEDDYDFYKQLGEFLSEYIENYGERYGIDV
ncbi:hypothetical protein BAOM_3055 [Peribacillus asahii]|uniref:Uncharacterized protein n=1 Tax=Peribacillus asahii TaxID=228899 RepID=A0A3Q9RPC6_9BACI|nr:hypothetical protein [Peribacillus asahii]AZV43664.1 hypothetical protein BAOM_3055 [Peribacillus asahii]